MAIYQHTSHYKDGTVSLLSRFINVGKFHEW
jgi:hypothetical protein